jgi:hypothetical protein
LGYFFRWYPPIFTEKGKNQKFCTGHKSSLLFIHYIIFSKSLGDVWYNWLFTPREDGKSRLLVHYDYFGARAAFSFIEHIKKVRKLFTKTFNQDGLGCR